MSIAAAQAAAFVTEVAAGHEVWTIRDSGGFPTSTNASGQTAMPFWSKESRAQRVIDTIPRYRAFQTERLTLAEFVENWLPGLEGDGLLAGLNWSGARAIGYDMSPGDVRARIEAATG
jgi:hypothetical protein